MKYLKNLVNHNSYSAFIVGSDFNSIQTEQNASVSYCKNERHIHYNPYVPAKLLDILYSDANGNLSFTSEVLPASEGKTPIGLCITGTNFFGTGEKARWMSLKYMNYTTPDTGSLTAQSIFWGNQNIDISTINNIQTTYNGGSEWGYLTANWITGVNNKIPNLLSDNNKWNISALGTVNQYTVTDIDGKNKTNKILTYATGQSNWQTSISITNNYNNYYTPAACCCWRYHTLGTNQGDWYLGSCGEMGVIVEKRNEINIKLAEINTIYDNDCINFLNNNRYWTSTEYDSKNIYFIRTDDGRVMSNTKNSDYYVIAILQY